MTAIPQHMKALSHANEIRYARAALRREVLALPPHEGLEWLAELVLDPPAEMATATVYDVLLWPARMGRSRALRLLRTTGLYITENRQIDALTEGQRRRLADAVKRRAGLGI